MKFKPIPLIKARNMREAMSVFAPRPLTYEDIPNFYIETSKARNDRVPVMEKLKDYLNMEMPHKILFAGHRGSGKSTELVNLKKELQDDYFIVYFSVMDELDINNIQYSDLILLLIEKIYMEGINEGYVKNQKLIETIYKWFSDTTELKYEDTEMAFKAKIAGKTPGIIEKLYGIMASLTASFRLSSGRRKEFRRKIQERITQLQANCDVIINEIENHLPENKKLLVIMEDLDKVEIDPLKEIFYKHSGVLSNIKTRIIYSVPIFLLNSPRGEDLGVRFCVVTLPTIKVKKRTGGKYEPGIESLCKIVKARMKHDLLCKGVLNKVIEETGGVIRDMFKALENAANSAYYDKKDKIDMDDLRYGLNQVKNFYYKVLIGDEVYDELIRINKEGLVKPNYSEVLSILLNSQALIEYNGEQWFAIHPLVIELLKETGKLKSDVH